MNAKPLSWLIIALFSMTALSGCFVWLDKDYDRDRDRRYYHDRDDSHHYDRDEMHHGY